MPDIGDHYRAVDGPTDGPVYRVVGASDEVALLRVTDGDGRRVSSGEVRHVTAGELDARFAAAPDPDAGLTPVRSARNALTGLYWQFRRFL